MRRLQFSVFLFVVFLADSAHAAGLGFSVGAANERWVEDTSLKASHGRSIGNVSFIIDPAFDSHRLMLMGRKVLGYRLAINYETSTSSAYDGLTYYGFFATQNLGFRLLEADNLRLWLGPQFRTGSYFISERKNGLEYRGDILGLGVGAVMGFDVLGAGTTAWSFSFGLRRTSYWGDIDGNDGSGFALDNINIDHRANAVFLDLAVMFMTRPRP